MLERKLNKIDITSYTLDVLEGLQNIFQVGFFPIVKKIKLLLGVLLEEKKLFVSELLFLVQKSLVVNIEIIVFFLFLKLIKQIL